jgi:cytochrome P450
MQTRLRQEINNELLSESPSYAELDTLKFLNHFTKEVLRYYPPGVFQDSMDLHAANCSQLPIFPAKRRKTS